MLTKDKKGKSKLCSRLPLLRILRERLTLLLHFYSPLDWKLVTDPVEEWPHVTVSLPLFHVLGLLWRRQRSDRGAQDIGFLWQPMVWTGQVCLVRVCAVSSLIHTCMHTHMQPFDVSSPPLQIRAGVQSLWCDLPQQTVLGGEPGPRERRCAIWSQTCLGRGEYSAPSVLQHYGLFYCQ